MLELLEGAAPGAVIALGGGAVLSGRVQEQLRGETTVLLEIDASAAWERCSPNGRRAERPLARDRGAFEALHAERRPLYERLADAIVQSGPVARLAALAPSLRVLSNSPGARLLWASSASGEYPVLIGDGLLSEHGPELLAGWPLERGGSRAFCVTDGNVAERYGRRSGRPRSPSRSRPASRARRSPPPIACGPRSPARA